MNTSLRTALFLTAALALVTVLFGAYLSYANGHPVLEPRGEVATVAHLTGGTTTIAIGYAITPEAHERGLSGRASLAEGSGLLFVFDRADTYQFWMPDMHFAIDIIWIGEDKRIVDISEGVTPESYPTLFRPRLPARYVLEVNAGDTHRWGWGVGTPLSFGTN
jgi:uncharacterized membrane protein (UPF0127 family)